MRLHHQLMRLAVDPKTDQLGSFLHSYLLASHDEKSTSPFISYALREDMVSSYGLNTL